MGRKVVKGRYRTLVYNPITSDREIHCTSDSYLPRPYFCTDCHWTAQVVEEGREKTVAASLGMNNHFKTLKTLSLPTFSFEL